MSWLRTKASGPRILLTGSSGRIGTFFTRYSQGRDYELVGMDLNPPIVREGLADFIQGDIQDADLLRRAMQGCDTVAHLAAACRDVDEMDFMGQALPNNIIGTYRVYEVAKMLGVVRVVFTSSVETTVGYPNNTSVHPGQRALPENYYGLSKVTGEDIGLVSALDGGPASVNLRLGWVETDDVREEIRSSPQSWWMFLSERDCCEILRAALFFPFSRPFSIFDAMSRNAAEVRDLRPLQVELGYEPQDDARQMFGGGASWVRV